MERRDNLPLVLHIEKLLTHNTKHLGWQNWIKWKPRKLEISGFGEISARIARALRSLALRSFAHTNLCKEAHTVRLASHPNGEVAHPKSLRNKNEHVRARMETVEHNVSSPYALSLV
jgi:hypothetical protein